MAGAGAGPFAVVANGAAGARQNLLDDCHSHRMAARVGVLSAYTQEIVAEGTQTPAAVFVAQDAAALGALSRKGLLRELPMEIVQQVEPRFAGPEGAKSIRTGDDLV